MRKIILALFCALAILLFSGCAPKEAKNLNTTTPSFNNGEICGAPGVKY